MFIKNYRKISEFQWENTRNNKRFSHNQFVGGHFGKDHFYIDQEESQKRINIFKNNYDLSTRKLLVSNSELFMMGKNSLDLSGKKVLVIGGGPTTNIVSWSNLRYDYIIACNNFYKNEKLRNTKVDFVSFAPFMDLTEKNEDLREYLKKHQPYIGIEPEHSKQKEIDQLSCFLKQYEDQTFVYQTRYCSPIGMSTRQVVLSSILGAAEVYMVGLDLFGDKTTKHSYEDKKDLPRWRIIYGKEFQERQIIIFWDYLNKLSSQFGTKFINLSEGLEENYMSFASKIFSPLKSDIKKAVQ